MKRFWLIFILFFALLAPVHAESSDVVQLSIQTGKAGGGINLSTTLQILLLFTILSLLPSILVMTTCFVRIVIVLSFLRTSLTLQQPSNQIVIGLALFLTFFIMSPVWNTIQRDAITPMQQGKITTEQAFKAAVEPLKIFMLKQMKEKDLELFTSLSHEPITAKTPQELPIDVIIPSFMLAELKAGFEMGLLVMLPFLIIDLIVASILMTLGMMMLPPPVVSLPIKIMIFVLVDGWTLIVTSLVSSFAQ